MPPFYPPIEVARLTIFGVRKMRTSERVSASDLFLKNHPTMGMSPSHGTLV